MATILPSWVQTLDAMIAEGARVRAHCTRCREWRELDLAALRGQMGGAYSLINRQCRCRLTPGCAGWNRFSYLHGVFRPLRNEAGLMRMEGVV